MVGARVWLDVTDRWTLLVMTLLAIGFGFGTKCPQPLAAFQAGGSFSMQLLANLVVISLTGPLVLCATLWQSVEAPGR